MGVGSGGVASRFVTVSIESCDSWDTADVGAVDESDVVDVGDITEGTFDDGERLFEQDWISRTSSFPTILNFFYFIHFAINNQPIDDSSSVRTFLLFILFSFDFLLVPRFVNVQIMMIFDMFSQ